MQLILILEQTFHIIYYWEIERTASFLCSGRINFKMPKYWVPNFRTVWPKHYYYGNDIHNHAREPIVFQELRPLKLRNSVSTKTEKTVDNSCLQEMAVMFACLKANDFNEAACSPEITGFQTCYAGYKKKLKDAQQKESSLSPGASTLTARQLNSLLKKYPQFNKWMCQQLDLFRD